MRLSMRHNCAPSFWHCFQQLDVLLPAVCKDSVRTEKSEDPSAVATIFMEFCESGINIAKYTRTSYSYRVEAIQQTKTMVHEFFPLNQRDIRLYNSCKQKANRLCLDHGSTPCSILATRHSTCLLQLTSSSQEFSAFHRKKS